MPSQILAHRGFLSGRWTWQGTRWTVVFCRTRERRQRTITQLVSDIPSYGLNDKKMIEMAAFEEFGLLRRKLGHAEDYP